MCCIEKALVSLVQNIDRWPKFNDISILIKIGIVCQMHSSQFFVI